VILGFKSASSVQYELFLVIQTDWWEMELHYYGATTIQLYSSEKQCAIPRVYLGTTVINQNYIQEKITGRLDSGRDYFRSGSCVCRSPIKNRRNEIYRIIILLIILCGCEIDFSA
jgi:hypothetical protein